MMPFTIDTLHKTRATGRYKSRRKSRGHVLIYASVDYCTSPSSLKAKSRSLKSGTKKNFFPPHSKFLN